MSIFKRKSSSLDPAEKERRNKQTEYYALLQRCTQIPSDDKMILRKGVGQYQQGLISLLQKYRRQGTKDLKDLQIFLRKYIQRYKHQNPKYPTLKVIRGTQSCLSLQKRRTSLTLSLNNANNVNCRINSSSISHQNSKCLEQSKIFTQQQTQTKYLSKFAMKQEQKNYSEIIKKRKTQKLKISQNRVSVTIENEYQNATDCPKDQTLAYKNQTADSKMMQKQTGNQQKWPNLADKVYQKEQPTEFLETMRFRMKIDHQTEQPLQQEQEKNLIPEEIKMSYIVQAINKFTQQALGHAKINQPNYQNSNFNQALLKPFQIKRKLFDCVQQEKDSISQKKLKDSGKKQSIGSIGSFRQPLGDIFCDNNFVRYGLQQSKNPSSQKNKKQKQRPQYLFTNFNQGNKPQDSIHRMNSQTLKESLIDSVKNSENSFRINSLSTIYKENQQNQPTSFYLNSQRKKSLLFSHRLPEEGSNWLNNSVKDGKQSKSSRMLFSHRMQQIISGRDQGKQQKVAAQQVAFSKPQTHFATPTNSFRQKNKSANKLEFWARIQSTINE